MIPGESFGVKPRDSVVPESRHLFSPCPTNGAPEIMGDHSASITFTAHREVPVTRDEAAERQPVPGNQRIVALDNCPQHNAPGTPSSLIPPIRLWVLCVLVSLTRGGGVFGRLR